MRPNFQPAQGRPLAVVKEYRVSHAVLRQEGLGRFGAEEYIRSSLETSWVAGTQVTRYTRTWRLSRYQEEGTVWAGHIGFVKEGEISTLAWDDSTMDFIRGEASSGIVVPFIIDLATCMVSFQLIPGKIRPTTVTSNLEALLNREGSYHWGLDLVSFPKNFDEWVMSVAAVSRFNASIEQPNPTWTGRRNIESLMTGLNAEVIRLKARAEMGSSLDVTSDLFRQALDHARRGYAKVELTGIDKETGTESKYLISKEGGVVPAVSRVPVDIDTETEIPTAKLRQAQVEIIDKPQQRVVISVSEDTDDDETQ